MLIHVRLLHCASKLFIYAVPSDIQNRIEPGILVQVPLQNRVVPAMVEGFANEYEIYDFEIKSIHSIYPFPHDHTYDAFIKKISDYYQIDSLYLFKRVQKFLHEKEEKIELFLPKESNADNLNSIVLTAEQQVVYQEICRDIQNKDHNNFVLHGVTGSGKTEIYKQLIRDALQQQKTVIFMLPEVTLAARFETLLETYFFDVPVIGFHSATTVKKKRLLWQLLLEAKPVVIIGVHLPILLPISNLGLIIVDEEHDAGYQEKKHPKIQSRDIAVLKASLHNVPIVLGSATPSIQTLWNVQNRSWKLLQLKTRFAGSFPKIEIVLLKTKEKRDFFWITEKLRNEISNRLAKKEQVIIFLNRRGYSFFVQCPCGFVFTCHRCSVSLTLHSDHYVVCHYCAYKELLRSSCPKCHLSDDAFLKKGVGTQQVVSMLQKLFPQAVIARADADTTSKKRTWHQTVNEMLHGEIDILVGTQSITKGYHFPKVTLVGILWADLNLHFPIYNAAETTLQQLIQVAGRAGRQLKDSLVIIQTFDNHAIYQYVDELRYLLFYESEIVNRKEVGYPPCKHIAEIEVRHEKQVVAESDAKNIVEKMLRIVAQHKVSVDVCGPVAAIVYKIKDVYVQKIMLKSLSRAHMVAMFHEIQKQKINSSLSFTIDPVS